MIRIGSDTDIGMNRNSSDWLGMNSYPTFSPGQSISIQKRYIFKKLNTCQLPPEIGQILELVTYDLFDLDHCFSSRITGNYGHFNLSLEDFCVK